MSQDKEAFIVPTEYLKPVDHLSAIVLALTFNGLNHLLTTSGLEFEATEQELKNTLSTFSLRKIDVSVVKKEDLLQSQS